MQVANPFVFTEPARVRNRTSMSNLGEIERVDRRIEVGSGLPMKMAIPHLQVNSRQNRFHADRFLICP